LSDTKVSFLVVKTEADSQKICEMREKRHDMMRISAEVIIFALQIMIYAVRT